MMSFRPSYSSPLRCQDSWDDVLCPHHLPIFICFFFCLFVWQYGTILFTVSSLLADSRYSWITALCIKEKMWKGSYHCTSSNESITFDWWYRRKKTSIHQKKWNISHVNRNTEKVQQNMLLSLHADLLKKSFFLVTWRVSPPSTHRKRESHFPKGSHKGVRGAYATHISIHVPKRNECGKCLDM